MCFVTVHYHQFKFLTSTVSLKMKMPPDSCLVLTVYSTGRKDKLSLNIYSKLTIETAVCVYVILRFSSVNCAISIWTLFCVNNFSE